jgi:hypothetical protein
VRAVNQYRRRDVLTYLGLRYYLPNTAARTDYWARQVATDLVLTRTDLPYFRALHFKDSAPAGQVEHRPIFLPSANEALAEAALLDECANHPQAFANPRCVFSYELSRGEERRGIFQPYLGGLGTSELMRFAAVGADAALMKSGQPLMRETASLHGLSKQPRHPDMLETVFDEDETLAMDAIEQLQQSMSA